MRKWKDLTPIDNLLAGFKSPSLHKVRSIMPGPIYASEICVRLNSDQMLLQTQGILAPKCSAAKTQGMLDSVKADRAK